MNKKAILSFLILLVSGLSSLHGQSCDKCDKRTIAFYDAAVLVPRPTGTDSLLRYWVPRWWQLFSVTTPARAELRTGDATFDCIHSLDGALLTGANGAFRDTLTTGSEHANVAPAGPISSADYIFIGSCTGTCTDITMELRIEAGRTRELVLSGSASFADLMTTSDVAHQIALGTFSPILQKIRDWERQKRDTDPGVALGPREIIVTLEKPAIRTNETVRVFFEYKDCDGVPLKDKKLYLNGVVVDSMSTGASTLGRFDKDSLLTDADGKAEATFTPSGATGTAQLQVCGLYKFPFGAQGVAGGHAVLFIETPPVAVWKVTGIVTTTNQKTRIDGTSFSGIEMKHAESDYFAGIAQFSLLVLGDTTHPGEFHFYGEGLLSRIVNGRYNEIDNLSHEETALGQLTSAERRTDNYDGKPVDTSFSFTGRYQEGDRFVQFDAPCYRNGVYGTTGWIWLTDHYGWDSWSADVHDQVSGAFAEWYEGEANGSLIKTDTGFIGNGIKNTVTEHPEYGQIETLVEQFSFEITPYSSSGAISVQKSGKAYSAVPELYPNYPNPFNPATVIRYGLPSAGHVDLRILDPSGKEIARLANEFQESGTHSVKFDVPELSSGIYFCRLVATCGSSRYVATRRFTFMK